MLKTPDTLHAPIGSECGVHRTSQAGGSGGAGGTAAPIAATPHAAHDRLILDQRKFSSKLYLVGPNLMVNQHQKSL